MIIINIIMIPKSRFYVPYTIVVLSVIYFACKYISQLLCSSFPFQKFVLVTLSVICLPANTSLSEFCLPENTSPSLYLQIHLPVVLQQFSLPKIYIGTLFEIFLQVNTSLSVICSPANTSPSCSAAAHPCTPQ